MKQTKIIYSKKVMTQLFEQGFRPIEITQNPLKPEFYCWVFEVTEEFQKALDEILEG